MILGWISLTLFMSVQTNAISHSSAYFLPLEWVHFLVFVMALVFIFQGILMMFVTVPVKKSWDRCNEYTWEQMRVILDEDQKQMGEARSKGGCCFNVFYSWDRGCCSSVAVNARDVTEFHLLRGIFLKVHDLPQRFDFTKCTCWVHAGSRRRRYRSRRLSA